MKHITDIGHIIAFYDRSGAKSWRIVKDGALANAPYIAESNEDIPESNRELLQTTLNNLPDGKYKLYYCKNTQFKPGNYCELPFMFNEVQDISASSTGLNGINAVEFINNARLEAKAELQEQTKFEIEQLKKELKAEFELYRLRDELQKHKDLIKDKEKQIKKYETEHSELKTKSNFMDVLKHFMPTILKDVGNPATETGISGTDTQEMPASLSNLTEDQIAELNKAHAIIVQKLGDKYFDLILRISKLDPEKFKHLDYLI